MHKEWNPDQSLGSVARFGKSFIGLPDGTTAFNNGLSQEENVYLVCKTAREQGWTTEVTTLPDGSTGIRIITGG
jgi:hypothetical protein